MNIYFEKFLILKIAIPFLGKEKEQYLFNFFNWDFRICNQKVVFLGTQVRMLVA